jgi:hypothetical protein
MVGGPSTLDRLQVMLASTAMANPEFKGAVRTLQKVPTRAVFDRSYLQVSLSIQSRENLSSAVLEPAISALTEGLKGGHGFDLVSTSGKSKK